MSAHNRNRRNANAFTVRVCHPLPAQPGAITCAAPTVTMPRPSCPGCGKPCLFYSCTKHPFEGSWGCPEHRNEPAREGCTVIVY